MVNIWNRFVEFHRSADLIMLIQVYAAVGALIGVLILLIIWAGARRIAKQARRRVSELAEDLKQLHQNLSETEYQLERKFSSRASDLEGLVARRINEKTNSLRGTMEQLESKLNGRTAGVVERVENIEAEAREFSREVETFRGRVQEVEERIPNLYDRMEEFRNMLSRIFRSELGAVLDSFDSSVGSVLEQMKAELHMGISRIEAIESMVHSRKRAQQALLGEEAAHELAGPEKAPEGEPLGAAGEGFVPAAEEIEELRPEAEEEAESAAEGEPDEVIQQYIEEVAAEESEEPAGPGGIAGQPEEGGEEGEPGDGPQEYVEETGPEGESQGGAPQQ